MTWKNRIKELRYVRAGDLIDNPANWRTHGADQSEAIRSVLDDVGVADALLARETERGLMLLNGHGRKAIDPNAEWPVLVLDVTDAEADKLLAALDPTAAMAGVDGQKMADLLGRVSFASDALADLVAGMAAAAMPDAADADAAREKLDNLQGTFDEFVKRRQDSAAMFDDKAEVNFWVCLVFQSWLQKRAFLTATADLPTLYGMYVDGESFAARYGVELPAAPRHVHSSPLDRRLAALALSAKESEHGEEEG